MGINREKKKAMMRQMREDANAMGGQCGCGRDSCSILPF